MTRRLPMFPLGTVLFPYAVLPLHVFEPRYRALTEHCLAGDGCFGVVLIERGSEVGGGDTRFAVAPSRASPGPVSCPTAATCSPAAATTLPVCGMPAPGSPCELSRDMPAWSRRWPSRPTANMC